MGKVISEPSSHKRRAQGGLHADIGSLKGFKINGHGLAKKFLLVSARRGT
jgi:hypothetical protein